MNKIKVGILLCQCGGKVADHINLKELTGFLQQQESVLFIEETDLLCQGTLLKKAFNKGAQGLIIAGCVNKQKINAWRSMLESSDIPVFSCEFVDLMSLHGSNNTKLAGMLIKAYIHKIIAGYDIAHKAKPSGIKRLVEAEEKVVLDRRDFFRLPFRRVTYEELPVIDYEHCIAAVSSCCFCTDACAADAIKFLDGKRTLMEEKCLKCGLCSLACPNDCIQLPGFSEAAGYSLIAELSDYLFEEDANPFIVFTCEDAYEEVSAMFRDVPEPGICIQVPCLTCISYSQLLLTLNSRYSDIFFVCSRKKCIRTKAFQKWTLIFKSIKQLADSVGWEERLCLIQPDDIQTADKLPLKFKMPEPCSFQVRQNDLPPAGGRKRAAFLAALRKYPLDNKKHIFRNLQLPFYNLSFQSDKCSMCGICTEKCPVKALFIEEKKTTCLYFRHSDCIGCGTCYEKCPEKAIELERLIDLDKLITNSSDLLLVDEMVRCKKCGKIIGQGSLFNYVNKRLVEQGLNDIAEKMFYCENCRF